MDAYRAACVAGMSDAEFWASTPYLTRIFVECAVERQRMGYHRVMYAAWHAAAFERMKKMPPLERALKGLEPKRPPRRMNPKDLLKQVEIWNRALGGVDRRKPKTQTKH